MTCLIKLNIKQNWNEKEPIKLNKKLNKCKYKFNRVNKLSFSS